MQFPHTGVPAFPLLLHIRVFVSVVPSDVDEFVINLSESIIFIRIRWENTPTLIEAAISTNGLVGVMDGKGRELLICKAWRMLKI